MQSVRQCIEDVTYIMGAPRSRVNSIARSLIDADVLPKSSGRAIQLVDAVQLSGLVAAVAMADKVEDAAEVAKAIMNLPLNGEDGEVTFKASFAASMSSAEDDAAPTVIFSKTRRGFTADIEGMFIHNGDLSRGRLPFWQHRSWGGWTRTSLTLAPEGFTILRNLFRR